MFGSKPDLKSHVQNLGVRFHKTWGPKTVYFWVVLRQRRDLSADIFGTKRVIDK